MRTGSCALVLFFCLLIGFFPHGFCRAAELDKSGSGNEVLAIGSGPVEGENMAVAREQAISDALTKGVEYYLCSRLEPAGITDNFRRLTEDIIPKAREEVENFHILTEKRIGDYYRILVKIRVNEKVIDERLREAGFAAKEEQPLKVIFLVSEARGGTLRYWWKNAKSQSVLTATDLALHKYFEEMGFSPINRTLGVPETECTERMRSIELGDQEIMEWGRVFDADLVVCGSSRVTDGEEISMSIKAYDMKKKAVICRADWVDRIEKTDAEEDPVPECIDATTKRLASEVSACIGSHTGERGEKINFLSIDLKGLKNYQEFRRLTDFLRKEVQEVKTIKQTGLSSDSISIDVEFTGDRETFLKQLLNLDGLPFPMSVTGEEKDKITLFFH